MSKPLPVGFGQNDSGVFSESLGHPLSELSANTVIAGFKRPEIKATPSHHLYYKATNHKKTLPIAFGKEEQIVKNPSRCKTVVCLPSESSINSSHWQVFGFCPFVSVVSVVKFYKCFSNISRKF